MIHILPGRTLQHPCEDKLGVGHSAAGSRGMVNGETSLSE